MRSNENSDENEEIDERSDNNTYNSDIKNRSYTSSDYSRSQSQI